MPRMWCFKVRCRHVTSNRLIMNKDLKNFVLATLPVFVMIGLSTTVYASKIEHEEFSDRLMNQIKEKIFTSKKNNLLIQKQKKLFLIEKEEEKKKLLSQKKILENTDKETTVKKTSATNTNNITDKINQTEAELKQLAFLKAMALEKSQALALEKAKVIALAEAEASAKLAITKKKIMRSRRTRAS